MGKTNKQQVLDYLWLIAPKGATNGQIRKATGITPHQQVYLLTQELMHKDLIHGQRNGREWIFYADESAVGQLTSPGKSHLANEVADSWKLSPKEFETLTQQVMSQHFGKALTTGEITGVPKRFDFVLADQQIVGDAKYYTLVRGKYLPPAKFSIIAEHVWLLEKIDAGNRFLVFGNDIEVPRLWLARYGALVSELAFYFLDDSGQLEPLN